MRLKIDMSRATDGRSVAQVRALPGVIACSATRESAITGVEALAMRALADRIEQGEDLPVPVENWFRLDEADVDDVAVGRGQMELAGQVLEPEDFSDWPGYPGNGESP